MAVRSPVHFISALFLIVGLAYGTAEAQSGIPISSSQALLDKLFRTYDRDADGLTKQELEYYTRRDEAGIRARQVSYYARYDLNGDGNLTRTEVEHAVRMIETRSGRIPIDDRKAKTIEKKVAYIMKADLDGDEIITYAEMRSDEATEISSNRNSQLKILAELFERDPNNDGRLTIDEATALKASDFRRDDRNTNGVIETHELVLKQNLRTSKCKLPKPGSNELVVLFGSFTGRYFSTAAVAGMDDVTRTGKLIIEPGEKPLYIVLSAVESTIWQFKGATNRISRVAIVMPRGKVAPGAGILGLQQGQVSFAEPGSCPAYYPGTREGILLTERMTLEAAIDRPFDIVTGELYLEVAHLPPRGQGVAIGSEPIPEDPSIGPVQQFGEFKFRVADIDPANVIAPKPAQRYEILPRQAGLVQLLNDGSIEKLDDDRYRIRKPIVRFPGGLSLGPTWTFLLPKGVSMPSGSPGNSCVVSEETGQVLINSRHCRTN